MAAQDLTAVFKEIDKDNSGFIDLKELEPIVRARQPNKSNEEIKALCEVWRQTVFWHKNSETVGGCGLVGIAKSLSDLSVVGSNPITAYLYM